MKAISIAKAYLRKRRICAERGRQGHMQPLRITKKMLLQARRAYADRIDSITERIRNFSPEKSERIQKREFTGYRILSYNGDAMGKVLTKDGRIFRGIYAESADWFKGLWNTGIIQTLANDGLMPQTTVTEYETEEFPIILEHRKIEISTAKMWNPEMTRDACITICLIDSVCRRFGYKLIDGHLNNVSFAAGKPVFTDIGSIVEDRGQYTAYESSLIFAGGYKLIAAALGNSIIARIQFFDEDNNAIWPAPFQYDESTYECRCLLKNFRNWHRWHSSRIARKIIFRLFELGEICPEYFELIFPNTPLPRLEKRDCTEILNAIEGLEIQSATVVGESFGLAQQIYDRFGYRTVLLNHSVEAARYSYRNARGVSCYCHNYLYGCDDNTLRCIKSELAVAELVTENLVSYQNWRIESLFNGLSKLTDRYAVVSVRLGMAASRCVDNAQNTKEAFENKFSDFFCVINAVESDGVWIFLGEKREADVC